MKSEVFKKLADESYNEKYSNEYVNYLIKDIIYSCKENKCTLEYITNELVRIYGDHLKESWVRKNLTNNYSKNGVNNYINSDDEKRIIKFIHSLSDEIECNLAKTEEELYSELYQYVQNANSMLIDVYACYISLRMLIDSKDKEILLFRTYCMLEERFILKDKYDEKYNLLSGINIFYDDYSFEFIIKERICINILSIMNISTIGQIKTIKKNMIDLIFTFDESFYEMCNVLSKSLNTSLNEMFNEFRNLLNEKEERIIKLRFGYENNKIYTLEEVGALYNITRERIRQIESRTLKKIKCLVNNKKSILTILSDSITLNSKIVSESILDKYTNNIELSFILKVIFQIDKFGKSLYDVNYKCFYNSEYEINELISEILSEMSLCILKDYIKSFTEIQKTIFDKYYKKYSNVYIRKNMFIGDIFSNLIKNNFLTGFSPNSEEDYYKLKQIFINEIGEIDDYPSVRNLSAMLNRDADMILCDRGKVIHVDNINDIPEELCSRIIDYVYESKSSIYYNSIFDKFRNELEECGINNQYLLKGLIDRKIPDDFHTRRDFIMVGENAICPYERIINMIHSFNGVFSLNDLKKDFNGVADYVFFNILYSEKQNGLVFLENKRFVYSNKLNISDKDITNLKKLIDELFHNLNSETISVRKVYARIKLFEDKYDINIKLLNSYFDLFSIIQLLFPNDYYYSRPFISTNPNMSTSNEQFLRNYLVNFDSFTNKDVKNYFTKMNVRGLYSYLMFMESMSDEYVQVDMDKMVKKEIFNISDDDLRNIKKVLNLLLNNYDCIDTKVFKGYSIFPKINYEWNKYLLVGIIRSYLSDFFAVENTANTYHLTDFIIRRYDNE